MQPVLKEVNVQKHFSLFPSSQAFQEISSYHNDLRAWDVKAPPVPVSVLIIICIIDAPL